CGVSDQACDLRTAHTAADQQDVYRKIGRQMIEGADQHRNPFAWAYVRHAIDDEGLSRHPEHRKIERRGTIPVEVVTLVYRHELLGRQLQRPDAEFEEALSNGLGNADDRVDPRIQEAHPVERIKHADVADDTA